MYRDFLIEILGVSHETAEKDACAMEHFLSSETEKKIMNHVKKIKQQKSEKTTA